MVRDRKIEKKEVKTLSQIIDKIETERVQKISNLQKYTVGTLVEIKSGKYRGRKGRVIEVSPKRTSVIVEFRNSDKQRYFLNKKGKRELISSLSNLIKEAEKDDSES